MNEEIKKADENFDSSKNKKKSLFGNFFNRIKKIKHLDKILTVLFVAIILLIYFSSFSFGTNNKLNTSENSKLQTSSFYKTSLTSYQNELETKIASTLSKIKDAGNVKVMVYFNEGIETVIAYTTKTEINTNGTKVETKSPVLVTKDGKSEPIILQEIMPQPVSIVIVSTGASNTNVKLEILRAVQAMFNFNNCKIEIFAGN
ncbi:MAG: hypothetical protein IJB10_05145 [Clostridia bacterium]|nr:hypothetical protein [Clostridia bacterium]